MPGGNHYLLHSKGLMIGNLEIRCDGTRIDGPTRLLVRCKASANVTLHLTLPTSASQQIKNELRDHHWYVNSANTEHLCPGCRDYKKER